MTLVTPVSSGDFGLDVLLGGGLRLVERVEGKRSATVLVRGSAGVGKSIWSLQLAKALAEALEGDVLVACVEILPREVVAQASGARPDLTRIAALPSSPPAGTGPAVVVGLLPDMEPGAVDLVAGIEQLRAAATAVGTRPVAVVVDSLIQDYLGEPSRLQADGLMKYAGSEGLGLVLCEEQLDEYASPWVFSADTVIELASGLEAPRTGRARTLQVRKHRFGPSVSGRHSFRFSPGSPEVAPDPASWPLEQWVLGRDAGNTRAPRSLAWHPAFRLGGAALTVEAALIAVVAEDRRLAALLAAGLLPLEAGVVDVVFGVDTVGGRAGAPHSPIQRTPEVVTYLISTLVGPAHALRRMLEVLHALVTNRTRVGRFVVGDARALLSAPEGKAWLQALQTFAAYAVLSGLRAPVICFSSGTPELSSDLLDIADATLVLDRPPHGARLRASGRASRELDFSADLRDVVLPERILEVASGISDVADRTAPSGTNTDYSR